MPTLELSTYKPNLNDPRIRRRIETILEWALPMMNLGEPFQCHRDTLTEIFGNQSSNKLGKMLRAKLLREESSSYKPKNAAGEGYCKTYRVSESGFNRVCAMLFGEMIVPHSESKLRKFSIAYAQERYAAELAGIRSFQYSEKSYRLHHKLQHFRRELKDQIFDGWYDYDISTAMPTIFWNLHRETAPKFDWATQAFREEMAVLPTMEHYIQNKAACRANLAQSVGIDLDLAKRLINGLFLGMKLVPHYTCAAYKLLGFNPKRLNQFGSDPFVEALRRDIRKFWVWTARRINSDRRQAKLAPIKKSLLYFYYEKLVLDMVRLYLDERRFTYFLEHDGFRSKQIVDLDELSSFVKEKIGFELVWEEAS